MKYLEKNRRICEQFGGELFKEVDLIPSEDCRLHYDTHRELCFSDGKDDRDITIGVHTCKLIHSGLISDKYIFDKLIPTEEIKTQLGDLFDFSDDNLRRKGCRCFSFVLYNRGFKITQSDEKIREIEEMINPYFFYRQI